MNGFPVRLLCVLIALSPASGRRVVAASGDEGSDALTFCCAAGNDLFQSLVRAGANPARVASASEAIDHAKEGSGVLVLADRYPAERTQLSPELLQKAKMKRLRLFVEYPQSLPGIEFGEPRGVQWERAVVASDAVGDALPKMRILTLHDCRFLPTKADAPTLVMARVAGFDTAVYGLPKEQFPLLFTTDDGVIVATTKLSGFVTARYAPGRDWATLWRHLLARLDPAGAPHRLAYTPHVRPAFGKEEALPDRAQEAAFERFAEWFEKSRLLVSAAREPKIRELLAAGVESVDPPAPGEPQGDGSLGILEGYASAVHPDGGQSQRTPLRADCQAESAAVLAIHARIKGDGRSRVIAKNLLDYLYVHSEMHRRKRGDPKHPAFGLIAWGAVSPAWRVANYGDDNARTLLATMLAAAGLESDAWDAAMLKALLANLRTTGALGFRGDRIDVPQLEQKGWKAYHDARPVNYSPPFEAYLWACNLWAYARTGERAFLDKTKTGIRMTMAAYPKGWRWGDNSERARMLLALAWLVRVEDTEEHRRWLTRVAADLLKHQQPCGAIPERLAGEGAGHYVVPASNEAYGTSETPILQKNGDPVSDQLYTTGFALLGLHEAVAATGDADLKRAEDKLADYLVRIQVRSETLPYLDGTWFRAFDYDRWDAWASSADVGWGAWSVESGWGQAWTGVTLGLRLGRTSLWDLTASSKIGRRLPEVQKLMSVNAGGP